MCGIWGAVSANKTNLSTSELKFINNAMVAGTLRGFDGTGYVYKQTSHKKKKDCLLYTSPSPRDGLLSRMPSSA